MLLNTMSDSSYFDCISVQAATPSSGLLDMNNRVFSFWRVQSGKTSRFQVLPDSITSLIVGYSLTRRSRVAAFFLGIFNEGTSQS